MDRQRWVLGIGLVAGGLLTPPCADAVILINEVLADPPALLGDANQDGTVSATQDEFVELVNAGSDPVSLGGWSLSDDLKVRHRFVPDALIVGGGFFVVFGGGAPQGFAAAATASTKSLGLNNAGDTLTLRNASAAVVDVFRYGAEGGMDASLTRSPDALGAVSKHNAVNSRLFSPGTTVGGSTSLVLPVAETDDPDAHPPMTEDAANRAQEHGGPPVPEPPAFFLLGTGLFGLMGLRRLGTGWLHP